jgi:voltage-gated potassium channel
MDIFKTLLRPLLIIAVFVTLSSIGYIVLEGYPPLDALYMTVISVTTVGYGEIKPLSELGKVYTMGVIVVGFILAGYSVSTISEKFIEGILTLDRRRKKMIKLISDLREHYIICGYGRIGKVISEELTKNGKEIVIIENSKEFYDELITSNELFLVGDATDDEILIESGIEHAKGLVAALPKDSDNLFITLTAKQLNKNLFIIARANNEKSERKLIRAGADKVFSPYTIGARRMVSAILKPNVLDFLDFTLHHTSADSENIAIQEVTLKNDSILVNKTLAESGIRKKYDAIVVAVKDMKGNMMFNPRFDYVLQPADTLILIAQQNNFNKLKEDLLSSK